MPVYCYRCKSCDSIFEARHSMSFENQHCTFCDSEEVFKIPSLSLNKKAFKSSQPGKIVDSYIQDAKREIKKEKLNMKSEEL